MNASFAVRMDEDQKVVSRAKQRETNVTHYKKVKKSTNL